MKEKSVPALLLIVLLSLPACAKKTDDSLTMRDTSGDFSTPFQVNVDNFVRRQEPAIYVQPLEDADHRPTALFVPLRMTQPIANAVSFSNAISRQFWQVWLSLNAFAKLEYAPELTPYDAQLAMQEARRRGAELVVGGYIHRYFDGGSGGESSMSLALEIWDVRSGVQLWSMSQGGLMEARQVHDFYLFSVKERNPGDPAGFIVRSLAWDMGRKVLGWVDRKALARANANSQGESLTEKLLGKDGF